MQRWISGERTWPAGMSSWQIYALPDLDVDVELAELLDAYAPVLRDPSWGCLAPAHRADLHLTIQPLAGWAHERTDSDLATVREAIAAQLAQLAPVPVTAGPALAGSSGVLLDIAEAAPAPASGVLEQLWTRVQAGISEALGAGALGRSSWPPHLTLAYATGSRDSGEIQSRLRRIRPGRARWTISSVHLCRVRQDAERDRYWWDEQVEIPWEAGPCG